MPSLLPGVGQLSQLAKLWHRPWVCSSTPNLALIGKGGWVQEPQNVKITKCAQNYVFCTWKLTQ